MKAGNILAHRGWWENPDDKNSAPALERALLAGFGIETDFRDLNGALVLSHDPPSGDVLTADWFFGLYARLGADGRLALNIKADGLQDMLMTSMGLAGVASNCAYAFDMAVPDALGYLARDFPAYSRVSEYENPPPFLDRAAGIWVDNFHGDLDQIGATRYFLDQGMRAAIVSPELHGRDPGALWDQIGAAGLPDHPNFEICTDLPQQAQDRFA